MKTQRERWNAKFLAGGAQSVEPDPLLAEVGSTLRPGSALDLAGGAGRHAVWLARRGWRVLLTDISDEGVALAARRSAAAGVGVSFRRESAMETLAWARVQRLRFDLIAVFWFLLREDRDALPELLSPGGLLVYKTFTSEHARFAGGASRRFALHPGELGRAFPELTTILYRENHGVAELAARSG